MGTDAVFILIGTAVLAYAGSRLVDFAAALAEKARLTPAVIGLTIVAAGTSAPELAVSLTGALHGSSGIALGNVVGSNIANIGLILGGCAVLAAIPVAPGVLRFEYPFLVLASWITLLLCRDGSLDRLEGGFFLASMVGFTAYAVLVARREITEAEQRTVAAVVPEQAQGLSRWPIWRLALGVALTLLGLVLGGQVLVDGAVGIAEGLGITERVIGLTVVAVGTSLPELAVSLAAALKRQQEMAVANIVGSNVFNLLMILGLTGLTRPLGVPARMISLDLWVMMAFTVLLLPLVFHRHSLTRGAGGLLLLGYACYVAWLAWEPR